MSERMEECPAMAPTGASHRFGYNPFLGAHFCQDCGVCPCHGHNMLVLGDQPPLCGVEDDIPPRYRFIRKLRLGTDALSSFIRKHYPETIE